MAYSYFSIASIPFFIGYYLSYVILRPPSPNGSDDDIEPFFDDGELLPGFEEPSDDDDEDPPAAPELPEEPEQQDRNPPMLTLSTDAMQQIVEQWNSGAVPPVFRHPMANHNPLFSEFRRAVARSPEVLPLPVIPNFDPPQPPLSSNLRLPRPSDFTGRSRAAVGQDSLNTEQQGDMNELDDHLQEIKMIQNPDAQRQLRPTLGPAPPTDLTGGNRAPVGEYSPKTEQQGDRNQLGDDLMQLDKFQNIDSQPPFSATSRLLPQSGHPGGSSAATGDDHMEIDKFLNVDPQPQHFPTLRLPPQSGSTGGSSAAADDWPERDGNK